MAQPIVGNPAMIAKYDAMYLREPVSIPDFSPEGDADLEFRLNSMGLRLDGTSMSEQEHADWDKENR